jgi:DNA-binding SARP family transcriptional activator
LLSWKEWQKEKENSSFQLLNDKKLEFRNKFQLSFDLSFQRTEGIGQIFAFNEKNTPFSFAYINRDDGQKCFFIINSLTKENENLEIPVDFALLSKARWNHIVITFDLTGRKIAVSIDGTSYVLNNVHIADTVSGNFIFGESKFMLDVPFVAIRNIVFRDDKNKEICNFPLDEQSGKIAHDKTGHYKIDIKNPYWFASKFQHWEKRYSFRGDYNAGVTFDPDTREIVVINQSSIQKFNTRNDQFRSQAANTAGNLSCYSGEAVYDTANKSFILYNLADVAGKTRPFVSVIPKDAPANVSTGFPHFTNPLHHHAFIYYPQNQSLYIFGGYGNYTYSKDLFRYNFGQKAWEPVHLSGDFIAPRMHTVSGYGLSDKEMLIFGGVGNETGKQEFGKKFFFDLYSVNLGNFTAKRLWNTDNKDFLVPTRNLITDKADKCFYTLCFESRSKNMHYYLFRFDIGTGKRSVVSDGIPFQAKCIHSTAFLIYNEADKEFYAVTRESADNSDVATFTVYSLLYPPSLPQASNENGAENHGTIWWLILLIAIVTGATAGGWYRRKKRVSAGVENEDEIMEKAESNIKVTQNAIYIFGEFLALDKGGKDISYRFTPKIKQLFILLLSHSQIVNNEGIGTEKMTSALWPDKSVAEAKNIRGVTINHLRNLLTDFEGIALSFENNRWVLKIDEPFFCDYLKVHSLAVLYNTSEPDDAGVHDLIDYLGRGALLPSFTSHDWFDSLKIELDDFIIELITKLLPIYFKQEKFRDVIILANVLFTIDTFNKTAIDYKVNALKRLGKPGQAKTVQLRFEKDYREAFGTDFVS